MAFKKKSNQEQPDGAENTDETFGLPEIEYKPLNREEPVETTTTQTYQASGTPEQPSEYRQEQVRQEYTFDDDDDNSPWPKIFGIIAILALAGVAYWFFGVYQPGQRAEEKARQEQAAKDEVARREAAERDRLERARLDAEQRRADSLAALTTNTGTIQTLTDRTNRYYVVVASAIDGDLLMDKAKELSVQGISSKIIPPFGKTKFSRLAVAEGDTYQATQSTADGLKGQYGEQVWVVRY
ncbi:MAG TPA: hypothetical protein VD927_13350 [Chryseosolibacter sp.]|nr:hypothetical protein [Chryseosolibacter sp.]